MAVRRVCSAVWKTGAENGLKSIRLLTTSAPLCVRRAPVQGILPNQDIDVSDLESLEKYRSYVRYVRHAEEAANQPAWWHTFRKHREQADPQHGAEVVDIGLPYKQPSRKQQIRERSKQAKENKNNAELERAARLRTLKLSLERVQQEWERTSGPFHIKRLAQHYGVFTDLFPNAVFLPAVLLRICHGPDSTVHFGNRLTPTEAASAPQVSFEAEEESLWTLLLTCPDEHLLDSEAEYVHWMVGNIPGCAVTQGEELCPFLPPFPPRGTGFHRYVYVLFRQEARIDFQEEARPSPCHSLEERTFRTVEFYRRHQDHMTPAGLAFFQSQWDESVTNTFHHTLKMKEPVFEFIRPPVYHPPQVKFPHRKPLRYLDRYRDGKPHTYGIY